MGDAGGVQIDRRVVSAVASYRPLARRATGKNARRTRARRRRRQRAVPREAVDVLTQRPNHKNPSITCFPFLRLFLGAFHVVANSASDFICLDGRGGPNRT